MGFNVKWVDWVKKETDKIRNGVIICEMDFYFSILQLVSEMAVTDMKYKLTPRVYIGEQNFKSFTNRFHDKV